MQPDLFRNNIQIFKQSRGLILFEGILYAILGCLAIAAPVISSLATAIFLGILFVAGGLTQLFRTSKTWGIEGSWIALFSAIISLIAGIIMIINPLVALWAITTILIIYFVLDGIAKCSICFKMYKTSHKFWMLISALISFILAYMIFTGMPQISTWILGLFVGINMLFFGIMLLTFYGTQLRD
jgi:uncharacterized membrane protein HdeD (DUF308 family)